MPYGRVVLNTYGAPKLSELTECGAPPIEQPPHQLANFILTSIFIKKYPDPHGRLILMFGRRLLNAISEYISARELLLAYVQKLPQTNSHFLQAMDATTRFEQCVASACQAIALFHRVVALAKQPKIADHREHRLRKIWNRSKHFDEDLVDPDIANTDISAPVWLTNKGICCIEAEITFEELHGFLGDLLNIFKSASA